MIIRTFQTIIVLMAFPTALSANVDKVIARATQFHKTDKNCDHNTKKGLTSTRIKLKDSDQRSIGMVAVDPSKIPYGSLVYSPDTKRLFLACDIGGAVTSRDAAINLAKKKGLGSKYRNALVLDFYSKKEILDNHYGDFYIIKHVGDKCFYKLYDQYQNKRLDPQFWIKHIKTLQKNDTLKEFERALRVVPSPLREAVFLLK